MIKFKKEAKIKLFYLEGRFVGFVDEDKEKFKRIRVATAEGERCIKLAKELRYSMHEVLQPGDWIEILGEQKIKDKTEEPKLKAYQVNVKAPVMRGLGTGDKSDRVLGNRNQNPITGAEVFPYPATANENDSTPLNKPPVATSKTKACVMVCQKSSCRKRGADRVCQAITESIRDRGLEDQVSLKGTGCMKQCKQGPCVVFMPDKSRYTGVTANEIHTLVEKHFAAKLKREGSKTELSPVP
ncbi:MAG: OB-fold nucleic acid binding domain-containing protein [Coleofasciculaceae cyanobacterium]